MCLEVEDDNSICTLGNEVDEYKPEGMERLSLGHQYSYLQLAFSVVLNRRRYLYSAFVPVIRVSYFFT